jgi:hypothetical protein
VAEPDNKHHGGPFAWSMTIAGFALVAGLVFFEAYRVLSGLPTNFMHNWPVLALGVILFAGGVSCFLCKPDWHRKDGDEHA